MSILKAILHRWNKTSSAYDTIHPETEVAQVADWNQGIVNTLANTALATLVSTLTSDSLFATLLKKAMTALGVKYLAAQNGYVCLGDIFGCIIIQWGVVNDVGDSTIFFPIAFANTGYAVVGNDMNGSSTGVIKVMSFANVNSKSFDLRAYRIDQTASKTWCRWIAIGV